MSNHYIAKPYINEQVKYMNMLYEKRKTDKIAADLLLDEIWKIDIEQCEQLLKYAQKNEVIKYKKQFIEEVKKWDAIKEKIKHIYNFS
jgi:hypothetical protein